MYTVDTNSVWHLYNIKYILFSVDNGLQYRWTLGSLIRYYVKM